MQEIQGRQIENYNDYINEIQKRDIEIEVLRVQLDSAQRKQLRDSNNIFYQWAQEQIKEKNKKIEILKNDLKEEKQQRKTERKIFEDKIKYQKKIAKPVDISMLEEENKQLNKHSEELLIKIKELEDIIKDHSTQIVDSKELIKLKKENEKIVEENILLENQIQQLYDKLELSKKNELENKVYELEQKLKGQQIQMTKIIDEKKQLQSQIDSLENKNQRLLQRMKKQQSSKIDIICLPEIHNVGQYCNMIIHLLESLTQFNRGIQSEDKVCSCLAKCFAYIRKEIDKVPQNSAFALCSQFPMDPQTENKANEFLFGIIDHLSKYVQIQEGDEKSYISKIIGAPDSPVYNLFFFLQRIYPTDVAIQPNEIPLINSIKHIRYGDQLIKEGQTFSDYLQKLIVLEGEEYALNEKSSPFTFYVFPEYLILNVYELSVYMVNLPLDLTFSTSKLNSETDYQYSLRAIVHYKFIDNNLKEIINGYKYKEKWLNKLRLNNCQISKRTIMTKNQLFMNQINKIINKMNDIQTDILKAYGYEAATPQYKTIIHPLRSMHLTIEDHQNKQLSDQLQKLLDAERTRQMVEEQGITLEETKRYFQEKIDEYNNIISLKHLRSKSLQKANEQLKRYTGDRGKITNYHLVLNWQNVNLVFQELSKTEDIIPIGASQQTQSKSPKKQPIPQIKQQQAILKKKKIGLVDRLESKINDFETKSTVQQHTTLPLTSSLVQSRRLSIEQSATLQLKASQKLQTPLRPRARSYQYSKGESTIPVVQTQREKLIKSMINNSFNSYQQRRKQTIEEESENRSQYKELELSELNESGMAPHNLSDIKPYSNLITRLPYDLEEKEKQINRRIALLAEIKSKREPKYLHFGGSKIAVKNTYQNQQKFMGYKRDFLEKQLKEELRKLRPQSNLDHYDLKDLEGPPFKVDYQSSSLRQDYDDVKVSKILKKLI